MEQIDQFRADSIAEFHKLWGLPKPQHPLLSIVDFSKARPTKIPKTVIFGCYYIAIKRNIDFKFIYGQQKYDFDDGVMLFISPNQVVKIEQDQVVTRQPEGWGLIVHPDFFWNSALAKSIKKYEYFHYAANEALFLSEKEETIISNIVRQIEEEYQSNIDKFTQDIIISQIDTLLNYAERYYQRQFITRKVTNHKILERLEKLLSDYFDRDDLVEKGLPSVQYVAENLNISPGYLSGVLKTITGQSTQQHIQDKIIEKAKVHLSTTDLSISEIAYILGFEHPQSFSKLFKTKTNSSPIKFRKYFN